MTEIWKDIKDFEDKYQISNLGRIRGKERLEANRNGYRAIKQKIYKPQTRPDGYLFWVFYRSGKRKSQYIHRLVWDAFGDGEKPNRKRVIDHIDCDKKNNCITNLRILSSRDNTTRGKANKTKMTGVKYRADRDVYIASIMIDGKKKYIGQSKSRQEAALMYLKAKAQVVPIPEYVI